MLPYKEDFMPISEKEPPTSIEQSFLVEGECHGWRLDQFLQKRIKRLSRNRIQRVIQGECWVDGISAKPGQRVRSGQQVMFRRPAPIEPEVPKDISVLYTDPWFYAIYKPAGLPIHPSARYHHSTLTAVLRARFPEEPLQVAHRLDRETSGLLLVARHQKAGSALKKAFAQRKMQKTYIAIVHGVLAEDFVSIQEPLGPHGGAVRVRMAVRSFQEGGVPARTDIHVLKRAAAYTLVECHPVTGRQHQIRVHLETIGHPIVGDKLYPNEEVFITWADHGYEAVAHLLPLPRHALHAAKLRFAHPETGAEVSLACPLPADLDLFWQSVAMP